MKLFWSPNTRAVRGLWMLEETGAPYELVEIDIQSPESKANPALRAASPLGKVPALEDGPVRIWDSGAICGYLADQYPVHRLAPPIGDPQRGAYLMWLMFTNSVIEPAIVEKTAASAPAPTRNGWGSWESMLGLLRNAVTPGPWVLGERFSAADVLIGTSVIFMRHFSLMDEEPALDAYALRCAARPAYQRTMAIESGEGRRAG